MNYVNVEQRSDSWLEERMGSVGASEIYDATAKQANGKYYKKREDLLYKKLLERLGISARSYVSKEMQHGIDNEASARTAYEFLNNVTVKECGLFKHNRIANTHASPDGIVDGTNKGLEIKCPSSVTHLRTLMTGEIQEEYNYQIQWQISCAGFDSVDFVSYDPRFPTSAQLFVATVQRDAAMIAKLEAEVEKFLAELGTLEATYRSKFAA